MSTYTYHETTPAEEEAHGRSLPTDIAAEIATLTTPYQLYRITIDDEAEAATAIYVADAGRIGISHGADADWYDSTGQIEQDIEAWLNPD